MKSKLKTIAIAVFILVTLIVGTALLSRTGRAQPPGQIQEEPIRRMVSVSGLGQVSARPDQAIVRLGVQNEAETASEALTENSQRMQALLDALGEAGALDQDIQTQTLQLFPRYEPPPEGSPEATPELAGYTAANVVEVRLRDLDGLGELLDAAVAAGGNTIESIRFEVSDPSDLLDQARAAAMEDARHKADQLAALANAEMGDVLSINESTRTPPPVFEERFAPVERGAAVPIQPGAQIVEVEVQVVWFLE